MLKFCYNSKYERNHRPRYKLFSNNARFPNKIQSKENVNQFDVTCTLWLTCAYILANKMLRSNHLSKHTKYENNRHSDNRRKPNWM